MYNKLMPHHLAVLDALKDELAQEKPCENVIKVCEIFLAITMREEEEASKRFLSYAELSQPKEKEALQ